MAKKKQKTAYTSKPKSRQTKIKPEHEQEITGHENHKPAWRLERVDIEHSQWGWKRLNADQTFSILDKLKEYESRTWNEITSNSKRDHSVSVENLDKRAKKRLLELKYDDFDSLFRLRF